MSKNDAPPEILERIESVMAEAWQSPGGMEVDTNQCVSCPNHWHIMICPAVREIVGGAGDGAQQYARFVVNINKMVRMFDKRPRILFDTAQGESVPHVIVTGRIAGYKCDVSIMCCPPCNMLPVERVYTEGPKKGTVEIVSDRIQEDEE